MGLSKISKTGNISSTVVEVSGNFYKHPTKKSQVRHNTRPILSVNNRPVSSSRRYDLIDQFLFNEKSSLFLAVICNIKVTFLCR